MSDVIKAPRPAPVFFGHGEDAVDVERRMAAIDAQEQGIARRRRFGGKLGWLAAAVLGSAVVVQSFTIAALFPLHSVQFKWAMIDANNIVTVLDSSWDLPTSEREQLILSTSGRYVRACESWHWGSEQRDRYQYCTGLSASERRKEFVDSMNPDKNPQSPQIVYGAHTVVTVIPTSSRRVGPNSVKVSSIRIEQGPHGASKVSRQITTVDYVPVRKLAADVLLNEPAADVQFIDLTVEPDSTPILPGIQP